MSRQSFWTVFFIVSIFRKLLYRLDNSFKQITFNTERDKRFEVVFSSNLFLAQNICKKELKFKRK
jgi:hypothetical protein